MTRNFQAEAEQEARQSEAYREWVAVRVRTIHNQVAPADVLARHGVKLRYNGHKPEQFSCPFHGRDNKPSTRYYPAEAGKPAGVWCFVCQERWDVITLYKKFEQLEGSFTKVLASMERAFGIQTPEMPRHATNWVDDTSESLQLEGLFDVCERRLRAAKPYFTMDGYLRVGSVLDRLRHQVQQGRQTSQGATAILRQILDKVGEKVRSV